MVSKWLDLENKAPDGWFSQYDISVLYPIVETIPENGLYLEIGVNRGRSLWIARKASKPSVEVWGIDMVNNPRIKDTNFIKADSTKAAWGKEIDVLFIDGDHLYKGVKKDIDKYSKWVKKGGVMLFHDCDSTSPGVVKAVNEYAKKNELVVDLFKKPGCNTSIARIQL